MNLLENKTPEDIIQQMMYGNLPLRGDILSKIGFKLNDEGKFVIEFDYLRNPLGYTPQEVIVKNRFPNVVMHVFMPSYRVKCLVVDFESFKDCEDLQRQILCTINVAFTTIKSSTVFKSVKATMGYYYKTIRDNADCIYMCVNKNVEDSVKI